MTEFPGSVKALTLFNSHKHKMIDFTIVIYVKVIISSGQAKHRRSLEVLFAMIIFGSILLITLFVESS